MVIYHLLFVALIFFSPASAFATQPQIDSLTINQSELTGCTKDNFCLTMTPSEISCKGLWCTSDNLVHTSYSFTNQPSSRDYQEPSFLLWPKIIRSDRVFLAGVETRESTMYSGGGGSSTTLTLVAFLPRQPPFEVLNITLETSLLIRACFSEKDMRQRAGVCHDEYNFKASIVPTGKVIAGMPVLRYLSKATSFPGRVSRSKDSLAAPPLRKRDIIIVTTPQCSYQRVYYFNPKTRHYVTDVPLPDCSDYTVP